MNEANETKVRELERILRAPEGTYEVQQKDDGSLTASAHPKTEWFIDELARMDRAQTLVNTVTSRRLTELESKTRGSFEDDPAKLMGSVFLVLIGLQLLPLVLDMVKQWSKSSSLSV